MNFTDIFDKTDPDHMLYLIQESKKLEHFTPQAIDELASAMHYHKLRLLELFRAMRNYTQNPFGKYFTTIGESHGTRKTNG